MKLKNLLSWMTGWMVMCVLLVGCTDDALLETPSNGNGRFELIVSRDAAASRLALGTDFKTQWEPGDLLVMVDKTKTLAPIFLTCEEGENADKAKFVSDAGVPAGNYWVIYNYNENLVYGHQPFMSIDDVNAKDKLVLYGEVNVTDGTSSASVQLSHLYSLIKVKLNGVSSNYGNYAVGMYSSKKGFPIYKQFTNSGLVNAEYGIDPNSLSYSYSSTYFPSDKKWHNIRFGQYGWSPTYSGDDMMTETGNNISEAEAKVALVLPEDLTGESLYFYVIGENSAESASGYTCYEFPKTNVNLKPGTCYTVELNMTDATPITLTTVCDYDTYQYTAQLSTPAQCRAFAYCNDNPNQYYDLSNAEIVGDIDFENEPFFPLPANKLVGNDKKLSNISLEWSDEDNVGLVRREWSWSDGENGGMYPQNPMDIYYNVSDLTLENVTFKGKNYVGAFGGYNIQASNCSVIGSSVIEGSGDFVGGIVGFNWLNNTYLKVTKASVGQSCTVNGVNYVGGIVGGFMADYWNYVYSVSSSMIPLESCTSSATVTATGNYVGGIFGKIGGNQFGSSSSSINFTMEDYTFSVLKCVNNGSVTGKDYVGGIGGDMAVCSYSGTSALDRVVISKSKSEGAVSGANYVGGIVGQSMASVNTCYSIKTISASGSIVGGVVGSMTGGYNSRIANCYSIADLTVGTNGISGGIVGSAGMMTIVYSYFAGTNTTGCGIVGSSIGNCTVQNCLTVLASLGTNLGDHLVPTGCPDYDNDGIPDEDWNGDGNYNQDDLYYNYKDVITDSQYSVTSILANINVINHDNAYSTNTWSNYNYECVKFASFDVETDSPDIDQDTIK